MLNDINKPTATRLTGIRWGGTASVNLKDNIVINQNDAATAYALYAAGGTFTSNYNDLYVSGTLANIGYHLTQALKTFSARKDNNLPVKMQTQLMSMHLLLQLPISTFRQLLLRL